MTERVMPRWDWVRRHGFEDHAEDVTAHYARHFTAEADGQARWMLNAMNSDCPEDARMVRAVLASALKRAAMKLEADSRAD